MLSRHYERLCGWPRALNLLFDCDKDRRLMHIIDTTYWHHEDNSNDNDNSGGRNSEYHCFCLLRWRAVVRTLRWCWLEPIHRHKKTTISVERIQQATGILEVNNAKDISATTTKNASIDSIFNNDDHNTSFNITMRKSCWWKKTRSHNWWWWWWWWYCWERLWQQCESNHRKSLAKTVAISTYEWTYIALARLIINNKQLKSSWPWHVASHFQRTRCDSNWVFWRDQNAIDWTYFLQTTCIHSEMIIWKLTSPSSPSTFYTIYHQICWSFGLFRLCYDELHVSYAMMIDKYDN